ncbi:MAG: isoprenylcysteine carboxylmethyltransferase family protein [Proteobacteria bacterium]|nr:isoprenylcysteine carboxylmethyltransferase family protein [Pseudomonadota bacterium]
MRKASAVLGSTAFFVAAPVMVAGVLPWLLLGGYSRQVASWPQVAVGAVLMTGGLAVLLHAFGRFVREGAGTPAPIAPTERLVVGGAYRHVRNPMYVAVIAIIIGQALLFSSWLVAVYALLAAMTMAAFVRAYEEPVLARRYGPDYERYRQSVPGWLPRLTPWRGD